MNVFWLLLFCHFCFGLSSSKSRSAAGGSETLDLFPFSSQSSRSSQTASDLFPFQSSQSSQSSQNTCKLNPHHILDEIRKRPKTNHLDDPKVDDGFEGEVLIKELDAPVGQTVVDVVRAIENGESITNWSSHTFKLVSVNPYRITERICLQCPQKLNMVQSSAVKAVCYDGHINSKIREVLSFQAVVLDTACNNQTIHEVKLHHNAIVKIWGKELKPSMLLELTPKERQAFFLAYAGISFEGRAYFYMDKTKGNIGSITIREATILSIGEDIKTLSPGKSTPTHPHTPTTPTTPTTPVTPTTPNSNTPQTYTTSTQTSTTSTLL